MNAVVTKKRCAVYTRVSTDDQTCENQRRTISARYAVSKWFSDDGVSGTVAARQLSSSLRASTRRCSLIAL